MIRPLVRFSFLALIAVLVAIPVSVYATGLPTNLQATVSGTDGTNQWSWKPTLNADAESGRFSNTAPDQSNSTFSLKDIVLSGNVDPVINAAFNVTNNTAGVQQYSFIFAIPIVAQTPATVTGGSTGVTITDNNGGGATLGLNINGRPTYYSQIDGADWQPLTLAPLVAGNFLSASDNDAFGVPIPSLPGPAALSTIGIRYDFSLSAGDSAAFTGVFVVEAIPEPATCLLAVAGVIGCLTARRRG